MSFIYSLQDTWNAVGTTFNSILMNVSNGAGGAPVGAAASRLLNLQRNATSVFQVDINGGLVLGTGFSGVTPPAGGALITGLTYWGITGAAVTVGNVNNQGLQFIGNGGSSRFTMVRFSANTSAPAWYFGKSRGDTTTPGAVVNGDDIGVYTFNADDGATAGAINIQSAIFKAVVSGTVSTGIVPTDFVFQAMNAAGALAERFRVAGSGNVKVGTAAIATTATDGFLHIPTCAGQPTGVPNLTAGLVPMIFDTTNSQFWFYTGGAWKQPKTPAAAAIITWQ